ncbi:hypothetical protein MUP79_03365 [Candidatus Bathyarchaeota archaeon]|nr:hypothetical protein [Candidatus Bathyarchaeota archaeon]
MRCPYRNEEIKPCDPKCEKQQQKVGKVKILVQCNECDKIIGEYDGGEKYQEACARHTKQYHTPKPQRKKYEAKSDGGYNNPVSEPEQPVQSM